MTPKQTLSDQVKEAERDKLISEKRKLDYELQQSKRFFTKNTLWTIIVTAAVFGFYYEFAAKPIIERDTILGSLENAKTKLDLKNKSKTISEDSVRNDNLRHSLTIEHFKLMRTADTLILARTEVNKARNAIANFTRILKSNPQKADLLRAQLQVTKSLKEINKYKIRADSLKKMDFNNSVFLVLHFVYKNIQDRSPVTDAYLSLAINPNQSILFPPFRINGGNDGDYNVLPSQTYTVILNSDQYKLKDDFSHFTSPPSNGTGLTVINIPIVDKN